MDNQKICSKCGQVVSVNDNFCPYCGSSEFNETQSANEGGKLPAQAYNTSYAVPENAIQPSMKWYKFLIYFALFAGAVANVITGLTHITGSVYNDDGVTADMVYAVFTGLKTIDVIFGILLFAVAGFTIYTRFRLAKFKANAPMCLYIIYGANAVISLVYCIAVYAVTKVNTIESGNIGSIAGAAVAIVINYTYFNKRKMLFTK